ncbi:MAG: hypothetical protein OHK0022_56170 [Roseiflexaceae bacterium]
MVWTRLWRSVSLRRRLLCSGFCDFPADPPELEVLWVITAGGRALDQFPFGEAVRLLL